ncbi:hypothetical protein TWF694_000423 [Orbilia ellipsospora]|uniref:Yeast cell wall synthesis Kre9/Knh1-like N-terminal domain-containing protein n=1 Tax=Orbilia ellipsospora TaxID=2528407 RepID=A0AAV9XQ42_9PEZI
MFTKVFASLLAVSASVMAYTTPTTFNATSNPIYTPGLGALVPVGQPYQVTWGPTEKGTVSIVLLRGPGSNIKPLYSIADKIANTGSFFWTPKASLEPDTTHYGLQIIIDSNGEFQYSPQFGISNPNYSTSSAVTSGTATGKATSTYAATSAEETTTSVEVVTHTTKSQVTSFITLTTSSAVVSSYVAPTYTAPAGNGTTTSVYVPSSTAAATVTTGAPPVPTQTGAASSLKVASGLFLGVAGVAAMLL